MTGVGEKKRGIKKMFFMVMDIYGLKKILKEKEGKEGRKRGSISFLLSHVIAGPGRHLYSTRRKC